MPLVADVAELTAARERIEARHGRGGPQHGTDLHLPIGVMIELPRAALTAATSPTSADFFSFGTNDLTQTTLGHLARRRGGQLPRGSTGEQGMLATDPFETLDEAGRRRARPGWPCTKDRRPGRTSGSGSAVSTPATPPRSGSSPRAGIDYLSCSPPRVPVARLEAGRQAVLTGAGHRYPSLRTHPDTR